MAEGVPGGFSGIYPILRALEDAGRIRRGYFVEGLGAAQFSLAGAIDRLRGVRDAVSDRGDARSVYVLAAADPANPYGAALPWPRRNDADRRPLTRSAGASVVLVDGVAVLYVERGGRTIQTLAAFDDSETAAAAVPALAALVGEGRDRELVVTRVDGLPVGESPHRDALMKAGFVSGYRGLLLHGR